MIEDYIIPDGWALPEISETLHDPKKDLVDGPFGSNLKSSDYIESGIPVFKIQNIKANRFVEKKLDFVSKKKASELDRHSFSRGDLIITKLGDPLGLCCKVPENYSYGIIVADLLRLRPNNSATITEYLLHLINSAWVQEQFKEITKGTTRPRVNLGIVRSIKIPLPPLAEQQRIVAKIEELFSSLDKGIETLKTAQAQLKVYRQAVLKYAFEGRLTNPNLKEGELPEGWVLTTLGDECEFSQGIQVDVNLQSENQGKYQVRFLRIVDFTQGDEPPRYIDHPGEKYYLQKDEIAMVRYGTVGFVCTGKEGVIANNLFKITPSSQLISKFLIHFLKSELFRSKLETKGANMQALSFGLIKPIQLLIPSKEEQYHIVQEIESRLSVCDKIEESIEQSLQQAEALRQSILKKAFEGKLVPQDPKDEQASELLERIKAEREKSKPVKSAKVVKKRKQKLI